MMKILARCLNGLGFLKIIIQGEIYEHILLYIFIKERIEKHRK